jgi:hypothetical protein
LCAHVGRHGERYPAEWSRAFNGLLQRTQRAMRGQHSLSLSVDPLPAVASDDGGGDAEGDDLELDTEQELGEGDEQWGQQQHEKQQRHGMELEQELELALDPEEGDEGDEAMPQARVR